MVENLSICESCTPNCCATYFVVITPFDAAAIAEYLNIDLRDFLTCRETQDENYQFLLGEENDLKKYELGLKQLKDLKCPFLLNINDKNRCGVHQVKPYVCKNFPFGFDEKSGEIYVLERIICATAPIPPEAQKNEIKKNSLESTLRWKKTYEIYDFWNKSVKDKNWEKFLGYLSLFSQNKLTLEWK